MTFNSSAAAPQVITTYPLGGEISFSTNQICGKCRIPLRGLDIELLPRGMRHVCRGCGHLLCQVIITSTST
jgi:hypothetical protein